MIKYPVHKKSSIRKVCLVIGGIVLFIAAIFMSHLFEETAPVRRARVFFLFAEGFMQSVRTWGGSNNDIPLEKRLRVDGDPARVFFDAWGVDDQPETLEKETIKLKVSRTQVLPGGKVKFEAVPSAATGKLSGQILLSAGRAGRPSLGEAVDKSLPLVRGWFSDRYTGTLRFGEKDSGIYRFAVITFPVLDRAKNVATSHISNAVQVIVTPPRKQLSGIFFQPDDGIYLHEDAETPLILKGKGRDGAIYDVSFPAQGVVYAVEDEKYAVISRDSLDNLPVIAGLRRGRTKITASYQDLQAEVDVYVLGTPDIPPAVDIDNLPANPYAIRPVDGAAVPKGEKIVMEVSSFDTSKGFRLSESEWLIQRFDEDKQNYLPITIEDAFPRDLLLWARRHPTPPRPEKAEARKEQETTLLVLQNPSTSHAPAKEPISSPAPRRGWGALTEEEREKIRRGELKMRPDGTLYDPVEEERRFQSNVEEWAPVRAGTYRWSLRYSCVALVNDRGVFEKTDYSPWSYFTVYEKGTDSEAKAPRGSDYMPRSPRRPPPVPYAITPINGMVVHKGTKVFFEASSFDSSKGHVFRDSSWSICRVTDGREVAYLRGGDSNTAEWSPRRTGTFEWVMNYGYSGGRTPNSIPARFVVIDPDQ